MNLSKTAIKELKKIWKEEFNQELTDEKAKEVGVRLLNFFKVLYKVVSPDAV